MLSHPLPGPLGGNVFDVVVLELAVPVALAFGLTGRLVFDVVLGVVALVTLIFDLTGSFEVTHTLLLQICPVLQSMLVLQDTSLEMFDIVLFGAGLLVKIHAPLTHDLPPVQFESVLQ